MADDLASAGISDEFVIKAIRGWRTGERVQVRKRDFTSSGRTYLVDRKPGSIDPTEARFFPKTPQLRMLAEEIAEIQWKEAERVRKQKERLDVFQELEREAERALVEHGVGSAEYCEAFDKRNRFYSSDLPPRKDLPYPKLKWLKYQPQKSI